VIDKPSNAAEYRPEFKDEVLRVTSAIVRALGPDAPRFVVVGGLAPTLLAGAGHLTTEIGHVGTVDADLGFVLVSDPASSDLLVTRLESAGFERDVDDQHKQRGERWRNKAFGRATIDILVEPETSTAGTRVRLGTRNLQGYPVHGVRHAIESAVEVDLGEDRSIRVANAGVLLLLKVHAYAGRLDKPSKQKDAYDIVFVLEGTRDRLQSLADQSSPFVTKPSWTVPCACSRNTSQAGSDSAFLTHSHSWTHVTSTGRPTSPAGSRTCCAS